MIPPQRLLLTVGAVLLLWATWMFRYDMQVATPGGQGVAPVGYVLDRWNGAVHIVYPHARHELKDAPAAR